jgi:peroxiredoxin
MHDFRMANGMRIAVTFALLLGNLAWEGVAGDDVERDLPSDAVDDSPVSFSTLLDRHHRQTLQAVAEYIDGNPQADDLEAAYHWLFRTALAHGLEAEGLRSADIYLKREGGDRTTRRLAQQVRSLGLAKTGKVPVALVAFSETVRAAEPQTLNEVIEFAHALAAQAQLAGHPEAARDVYERLTHAFFLNPEVRALSEQKLAKLDMIGSPAPALGHRDLQDTPVNLADYRGNVVLIDFWATNCPPCLEDFPRLKEIHSKFQNQGLRIIGVSLDDTPHTVQRFQKSWELPWRLVMSEAGTESIRQRYRVQTIPSVFLIDRQGRIAYVDLPGRDLGQAIQKLLGSEEQD